MTDIHTLLAHIDPARLDYTEWANVGMALKHEGATAEDFDAWSQRDGARYKQGEPHRKWESFHGSTNPVTAGTLVALAQQHGWSPSAGGNCEVYDWDSVIRNPSEKPLVDSGFVSAADVEPPTDATWNPAEELTQYLTALFESSDHVGYVLESYKGDDGRDLPKRGTYSRTSGEIIEDINRYKGNLSKALGDYDPKVGAWIRFNPLDGKGVKGSNVTSLKYALVECDSVEIGKQIAMYEELELPIVVMVHSGKRSAHAIVRIGAATMEEYRDRVNYLHKVCKSNGLDIDPQTKDPSRLSRMPGIWRDGQKQYIIATNQGRESFEAWKDFIEEANDSLPDFEPLSDVFNQDLPLANELIQGVLREGHKGLLTGPSKAGKSFMLLQLTLAIAEGRDWLGWQCTQGPVLYVNLELDPRSCVHRIRDLYQQKGWTPDNLQNIDLWNLRGAAVPLDLLAPKLIRRAIKRRYKAVIIDPIYKVITGDENAADKMAHFCNQFDRIAKDLGAAVIYCHHHSKGAQGQKSARDRSSGSGVFARDPDAILDIIELSIPESARKAMIDAAKCKALIAAMGDNHGLSQDDALSASVVTEKAREILGTTHAAWSQWGGQEEALQGATGWRMEGTLREFAPMKPREFWFRHPYHTTEGDEFLKDCKADGEEAPWSKGGASGPKKETNASRVTSAFNILAFDNGTAMLGELAESMGATEAQIKNWLKGCKGLALCSDDAIRTKADALTFKTSETIEKCMNEDGIARIADVTKALKVELNTARKYIDKHPGYERNDGKITRLEGAE